jgi:hypothetical protein
VAEKPAMTPMEALQTIDRICGGLTGYTIQQVDALRVSIQTLAAAIQPAPEPEPKDDEQ